jgi:hypothetical protein
VNQSDFELSAIKLKNVFGDKAYPPEKLRLIWEQLKHYSSSEWQAAVHNLILNHRYAPQMKEIEEALEQSKARSSSTQSDSIIRESIIEEKNGTACSYCESFGTLVARRKDTPGTPYAFRCGFCSAADKLGLSRFIPQWNASRETTYLAVKPGDVEEMFK